MQADEEDNERSPLIQSQPNSAPTPLPWGAILVLLMLNTVCPLVFEMIFPFISKILAQRALRAVEVMRVYPQTKCLSSCMSLRTLRTSAFTLESS